MAMTSHGPGWDMRRKAPRKTVDLYAVVKHGNVVQPARVKDVSTGGVRLEGIGGLRRGMQVTFEMISGRQYRGEVAWSAEHRLGLRFPMALTADDPLLRGAIY